KPTDNPNAYDAYLRGLAYTLKTQNTPENYLGAQKYFKEAVRLDPKFALAWALLSYVDARGYHTTNLQPTAALREEARQAFETALALDLNLGEAWVAKGYYHYGCVNDFETAVRCYEQARKFLPNSSRIPQSLAFVARDWGQWERSESYFNEAERLDPRNVSLLTRHAQFYIALRRFPEALRKLDQILEVAPNDIDALVEKAAIAQAEGNLPRAATLLAQVQPAAGDPTAWETLAYQAILERRPAEIISRLKELKPDPDVGYLNGELRFWLGWAQEVSGDHTAAQETWREARTELEALLKEQPDNWSLLDDLALIATGLGDKAAAFTLIERAIALHPIEKDAANSPQSIDILARISACLGEPDRAIAALEKILSIPCNGGLATGTPLTPALLIQVAMQVFPFFDIPDWVVRLVVLLTIVGFPVSLVCAWAFEVTPEGIKLEGDVDRRIIRETGRKLTALVVVVAAVAVGVTVFRFLHLQQGIEAAKQPPRAVAIESKSIAVLPFENLSEEKANAYFADGMQDEILINLARIADLKVISRTSVMQYKADAQRNLREIGQQLGVSFLLEGRVQRAANRVRVNAQLIDSRNGANVWAQTYDRDLADVFAIQSEIAKAIAEQLQAKLSPNEKKAIEQPPTTDLAAFDL